MLGPVMTKFTIALREIGTYKEVLRSQVSGSGLIPSLVQLWPPVFYFSFFIAGYFSVSYSILDKDGASVS